MTAPELFAVAHGLKPVGDHHCFYCGGRADGQYPIREYVRPTFTAYDAVARPASQWVCVGCVQAMRSDATVRLPDGSERGAQKPWQWSWCITEQAAVGYAACFFLGGDLVREHAAMIRRSCLDPPEPPSVIVLAGAGRIHQLYLARVNHSRESVSVVLDGERIEYAPPDLSLRLALTTKLAAAIGRPALSERPGPRQWINIAERYTDSGSLVEEWTTIWSEPLSRLAVFLTPNKEASGLEYLATAIAQEN